MSGIINRRNVVVGYEGCDIIRVMGMPMMIDSGYGDAADASG